jgi:cyclic lactone autoinducer peptide
MKKEILELLAKVAEKAAKRADGRASEFGMHQPKRPEKRQ